MIYFGKFYLDNEKDIVVKLYKELDHLFYRIETPYHSSGNLLYNLAQVAALPLSKEADRYVIKDEIPCFITADNRELWLLSFKDLPVAEITLDKEIVLKARIPAVAKILMSQTKDYRGELRDTLVSTYIDKDYKFKTDLHTHMNANLSPDQLIALGLFFQIRYPLYYIKKLQLQLSDDQWEKLLAKREDKAKELADCGLSGKYLDRKIDDNVFANFADLLINNPLKQEENIGKIRASLSFLKDGQAVFTNLEKVYLYRYVFTKGIACEERIADYNLGIITDKDIRNYLHQMIIDSQDPRYQHFSLFQHKLLWIARNYQAKGIEYVEISDTTLVKPQAAVAMLKEVHAAMPAIRKQTGVMIRFLAGIRRIPLTIVKDDLPSINYLFENAAVLRAIAKDPYVAGFDIIGEEINDIAELKAVFKELTAICLENPGFVARIHAGENDSLKDNVSKSIDMILNNLKPGDPVPPIRIGHGLYTPNLNTKRGKKLAEKIYANGVVLEFQITSNIRLNNLNNFDKHPLKAYLAHGLNCVQGSDGYSLYGSDPMEEQLALKTLLKLDRQELLKMAEFEKYYILKSRENFNDKRHASYELSLKKSIYDDYQETIAANLQKLASLAKNSDKVVSRQELGSFFAPFPSDKRPIILAGGSFNTSGCKSVMVDGDRTLLKELVNKLDPKKFFFVIGHRLEGYELELYKLAKERFAIFAMVPSLLRRKEVDNIKASALKVHFALESSAAGTYKSFNYEIFERMASTLIVLDGNSSAMNLIQEAKNGKARALIFVSANKKALKAKAQQLEGYVALFDASALATIEKTIS